MPKSAVVYHDDEFNKVVHSTNVIAQNKFLFGQKSTTFHLLENTKQIFITTKGFHVMQMESMGCVVIVIIFVAWSLQEN